MSTNSSFAPRGQVVSLIKRMTWSPPLVTASSDVRISQVENMSPLIRPYVISHACRNDAYNIHEKVHHMAMIPIVILIMGTNVLVFVLSLNRRYYRQHGNWLITSLCVADFLVGGISIDTIVAKSQEKSLESCLVHMGCIITALFASLLFLLAIALDRFLAITHALTYTHLVTSHRTAAVIMIACLISVIVGFAPISGWSNSNYNNYCSFVYVQTSSYVVFLLTSSTVPIFIIFVIYLRLYCTARRHLKRIQALESLNEAHIGTTGTLGWSPRDWKSFRRLVAVVGCVIITWSPFLVASLWEVGSSATPCWLKNVIGTHFLVLGLTNSFLNPLVYTVSTRDFRRTWAAIFFKNACLKDKNNSVLGD